MTDSYDLLITGGRAVTPNGVETVDLGIRGGRIASFGALEGARAAQTLDARGLHVLPGVIDTQVHFREPGLEHKEDLESGTRGAIMGGVTTVFEMPNTRPNTTGPAEIADKLARARGRTWCDHAFFVGAAMDNVDRLAAAEAVPGCCGVKLFMGASTGTLLVPDDATLRRALASGRRRVAIHSEDEPRMNERRHIAEAAGRPHAHCEWRDVESAVRATRRVLAIARELGRQIHVLHITTEEEIAILAEHRDIATVEVTPQHLTLSAPECYDRLGTLAQMNPPIREARHREGLWRGVTSGVVDVLGSDHAPHTLEEKAKPYPQSPSGMPGVQTLLPVMLDHVHRGRLTLERLVDLASHGPQRIYNIACKGRLVVGYDADIVLVDLKAKRAVAREWIESKSGWSPFEGLELTGWPVATILRGQIVMRDGQRLGVPMGVPARFLDTRAG